MGHKIAFIGLGIMGTPMAGHLMKAGHEIIGFDLVPVLVRPGPSRRRGPDRRPAC